MPDVCEDFTDSIKTALNDHHTGNAEERCNHICVTIYNSTMDTFGKRERQNLDWFEEGLTELDLVTTAKRAALVEHKRDPSEKSLTALRKAKQWCPADCLMLCQWLLAEPFPEYSTLHCLLQHLCHVYWHKESLWSKCHQDHNPQVLHWQQYHRLRQTDGEVSRTLPGTLLEGEHCHWLSCQEYLHFAYLGRAWHSTLSRGTEQGHQLPPLWQSSRKRWHPTRSHQGWQADCPPSSPPWASATVLGRGDCVPRYVM